MPNPSFTCQPYQNMLTGVDTLDELCSLTYLALTPHQSALKCMPYNSLLVVVV